MAALTQDERYAQMLEDEELARALQSADSPYSRGSGSSYLPSSKVTPRYATPTTSSLNRINAAKPAAPRRTLDLKADDDIDIEQLIRQSILPEHSHLLPVSETKPEIDPRLYEFEDDPPMRSSRPNRSRARGSSSISRGRAGGSGFRRYTSSQRYQYDVPETDNYEELLRLEERIGNVEIGISPSVLASFPTTTWTTKESDAHTCAICLERFKPSDRVRTLPCLEKFHCDCIERWLKSHKKCPVCRTELEL